MSGEFSTVDTTTVLKIITVEVHCNMHSYASGNNEGSCAWRHSLFDTLIYYSIIDS